MKTMPRETFLMYVRNFIFGAEDSLVSTVGLLSGVATGGVVRADIVITGVVLIFVEAFSMAIGSFLSEEATEEYQRRGKVHLKSTFISGVIMLVSYFVAGIIPLLPYLITSVTNPFWSSIIVTLISLFFLGLVSAKVLHTNVLRNSLRMLIIGGLAVGIGAFIGQIFN